MPRFDYRCPKCGERKENVWHRLGRPWLAVYCDECGERMEREMPLTSPPVVKNGTPIHHRRAPKK